MLPRRDEYDVADRADETVRSAREVEAEMERPAARDLKANGRASVQACMQKWKPREPLA
jgi:hypothetical protein